MQLLNLYMLQGPERSYRVFNLQRRFNEINKSTSHTNINTFYSNTAFPDLPALPVPLARLGQAVAGRRLRALDPLCTRRMHFLLRHYALVLLAIRLPGKFNYLRYIPARN